MYRCVWFASCCPVTVSIGCRSFVYFLVAPVVVVE